MSIGCNRMVLAWANHSAPNERPRHGVGEVRFAAPLERDALCRELDEHGVLVALIEGIGPPLQGCLGEAIDHTIERELERRGASGPCVASAGDRDAALSDQLYRARQVGAIGIAVVLGPLRAAAGALGALDPGDCAALRFLAEAARERPVTLLLDARDATTRAYADPVPLEQLVAQRGTPSLGARGAAPKACDRAATPPPESPSPALVGATRVDREEPWRAWTLQLAAARGPQPPAVLERLFAESYMPLANAVTSGLDDARARAAYDEFRSTFIRSYSEAFPTFAATTKRPRMVLDVHDVAGRIARLHGARSTRLLLVDGMRWDLSRLIQERLGAKLGAGAAMTDELMLWSALPTTTMRQLEMIARGVDALRAPLELDPDTEPARGRTAEHIRRLRAGSRELHKLDLVEARVSGARGGVLCALPEIAESAAEIIARHAQTLAAHTLLLVFGDHGFTIDRAGSAKQGGASPEEVLVGAFALLVGDVH